MNLTPKSGLNHLTELSTNRSYKETMDMAWKSRCDYSISCVDFTLTISVVIQNLTNRKNFIHVFFSRRSALKTPQTGFSFSKLFIMTYFPLSLLYKLVPAHGLSY